MQELPKKRELGKFNKELSMPDSWPTILPSGPISSESYWIIKQLFTLF